jgi:choline kinase
MNAIILAAGEGKRLASTGWSKPKCLLPAGRISLLDNILISLAEHGVTQATIVVGYQQELVRVAAAAHDLKLRFFVNHDYADTNTIHSLHLAREAMTEDFIYFNADVLFDRRIVGRLLEAKGSAMAIETKRCGREEVKVIADGDGRIRRIGKDLAPRRCMGEFIGVGKFCLAMMGDFLEALRYYNDEAKERKLFFEAAVDRICGRHHIMAVDIDPYPAIEIDTPEDLAKAQELAKALGL